jgi:hypothetical protein
MGALVLSRLVFVKELGLGVAFAVLLDATVVRAILVPALMKFLGSAAWRSPWSSPPRTPQVSSEVGPSLLSLDSLAPSALSMEPVTTLQFSSDSLYERN